MNKPMLANELDINEGRVAEKKAYVKPLMEQGAEMPTATAVEDVFTIEKIVTIAN